MSHTVYFPSFRKENSSILYNNHVTREESLRDGYPVQFLLIVLSVRKFHAFLIQFARLSLGGTCCGIVPSTIADTARARREKNTSSSSAYSITMNLSTPSYSQSENSPAHTKSLKRSFSNVFPRWRRFDTLGNMLLLLLL